MAIQAQHMCRSNSRFPFCINGLCTGGLMESRFNWQQQKHHQPQQQQPPQSEQLLRQLYEERQGHPDPNLPSPGFVPQFEKQWEEIDQHIKFQNEQLRLMIQEQEKQQVAALLKDVESRSIHVLRKKDEEIARAEKKRQELEDFLKRLEAENREWKRVAQEKEAIALALYRTLEEEKKERAVVANDAESCCDENEVKGAIEVMLCKSCHSRRSCFLFLPCRHLASCKACAALLEACPICRMPKKASIETLIF